MNNFIFALNATMPIFFVILIGNILRRRNIINKEWIKMSDKLAFKIAMPTILFLDIATMDKMDGGNLKFIAFCMISTTIIFFGIWIIAKIFIKDKTMVGSFAQGSSRGSAAVLGIPFVQNVYGTSGLVPLMILAAVPLFNAYSVIILAFSSKSNLKNIENLDKNNNWKSNIKTRKKVRINYGLIFKSILTNPLIIGIAAGFPFFIFGIEIPNIILKTLKTLGNMAVPLMLISIGGDFTLNDLNSRFGISFVATIIKLIILPLITLPIAVHFGIEKSGLLAILIMVGAPSAISGYIMSKNMDNDHVLMSNIVVMTTLFSSVTFTLWLFILKSFNLL